MESPGRNSDVPSLLPPYTTAGVIYCGDCHNNDTGPGAGGTGPRAGHGSRFAHILERNLNYGDANTGTNYGQMYAMCFKCHSQTSILGDISFKEHTKHIEGEDSSCTVCHDPHGISATQGNATENSHLINFATRMVFADNQTGRLEFRDGGMLRGEGFLRCHGKDH